MKPQSVSTLVLAGIVFAVGLYHLSVYLRSRGRRHDLAFGLYCLVVVAFDVAAAGLYESEGDGSGAAFQRAQFVFAGLGLAAFLRFLVELTRHPTSLFARALTASYVAFAAVAAVERSGWVLSSTPQTKHVDAPFGLHVVYYEMALGPLGDAFMASTVLLVLVGAWEVRRIYRDGQRSRALTLLLALGAFFAGILNDALVATGQIGNVYLFEYAFLAMVALVASHLSSEVVAAAAMADALVESESKLRTTLDAIADAVFALDARRSIVRMNPAAERLTGWPSSEAVGRPVADVVVLDGEDASLLLGADRELAPMRLRDRDGDIRWVRSKEAKLSSKAGTETGSVLVLHDVTRQRRMEATLRESQRIESLGRIAAGVAHDFNNLLTPILGFADASLRTLPPEHPNRLAFESIASAAERGSELTRQLLAFGRRQVLDERPLDVNAIIESLVPLARKTLREDIDFELALSPGLGAVRADRSQIERIVMNLVLNAGDAMPSGGRLRIATSERCDDGDEGGATSQARVVVLEVEDTGEGMSASTRTHLFEPFFSTKERGRGTGLGLATVHGIVQQHGGRIDVETEEGVGTTFTIYLPRTDEAAVPDAPSPGGELVCGANELVLLVDDDEMVRGFAATVLTKHGYRVQAFADGTSALRWVDETTPALDVVLSDLVMPTLDGRELCEAIRRRLPRVPTLLMTGYAEPGASASRFRGELLRKPFTDAELLTRIRGAIVEARRAARAEVPA